MRYILLLFLLPALIKAQELTLTIKVEGLNEIEGKLMFRVKNAEGAEVLKSTQKVDAKTETITLKLKAGSYALAIFHDANDNDKIDRAFTGIPTEKYAFSNNARGTFGPPDLEDQLFTLQSNKTIKVLLE